ncbi:hypothetical protein Pan216_41290 [Planctomycetes bacterium Pan216]|uniref:GYF domain-containing protein n=1 Tax=Kolteria novifilia TaxID=2527975 RepID=A0A518B8F9_9BACT|nr:hypothetical protein Pan216_41290 [Planctomycetes bacterium Pan216]
MSTQEFYVKNGAEVDGPFSLDQLRTKQQEGRIVPETEISRDRVRWKPAGAVRGLFKSQQNDSESSNDGSSPNPKEKPQWWLSLNGEPDGPFTREAILARIGETTGKVDLLACLLGEKEWKPISSFPEFAPVELEGVNDDSNGSGEKRWWLHYSGQTTEPLSRDSVESILSSRKVPSDALICLVGSDSWLSIRQVTEFARLVPPPLPSHSHGGGTGASGPVDRSTLWDHPLVNPRLPTMANWICIYAIVVSPVLYCLWWIVGLGTSPLFADDSWFRGMEFISHLTLDLAYLIVAVFLFVGGIRLKNIQRSGAFLTRWCIWANIILNIGGTLLFGTLGFFAGLNGEHHFAPVSEFATVGDTVSELLLPVYVMAFVFELFALVWIHRHEQELPLETE